MEILPTVVERSIMNTKKLLNNLILILLYHEKSGKCVKTKIGHFKNSWA